MIEAYKEWLDTLTEQQVRALASQCKLPRALCQYISILREQLTVCTKAIDLFDMYFYQRETNESVSK